MKPGLFNSNSGHLKRQYFSSTGLEGGKHLSERICSQQWSQIFQVSRQLKKFLYFMLPKFSTFRMQCTNIEATVYSFSVYIHVKTKFYFSKKCTQKWNYKLPLINPFTPKNLWRALGIWLDLHRSKPELCLWVSFNPAMVFASSTRSYHFGYRGFLGLAA